MLLAGVPIIPWAGARSWRRVRSALGPGAAETHKPPAASRRGWAHRAMPGVWASLRTRRLVRWESPAARAPSWEPRV